MNSPPVVIDNGTGYTKMGFAGNEDPQFVIPTAIATKPSSSSSSKRSSISGTKQMKQSGGFIGDDMFDFSIGNEAISASSGSYQLHYPIRHGQVSDWDLMEAYWQQSFYKYLRCDPGEQAVLLTEPPLNSPENREYTAEVMFETFNVPHLHIGVQATLALTASLAGASSNSANSSSLTGTVIDSGDGVTHIIPVVDGYAIGSAIKHVPIAGREMTHFIQQLLRERPDLQGRIAPEEGMQIARRIKEECCYVSPDITKEFLRFEQDPSKLIREFTLKDKTTIPIGHERFLGPEIFFCPELSSSASASSSAVSASKTKVTGSLVTSSTATNTSSIGVPLPTLVDNVVQACPIDCRRALLSNIVLSGGSTLFKGFDKRLQRDLQARINERLELQGSSNLSGGGDGAPIVTVKSHLSQRYAVWSGGSILASMPIFTDLCHSKQEYEENGPGICRQSRVFQ